MFMMLLDVCAVLVINHAMLDGLCCSCFCCFVCVHVLNFEYDMFVFFCVGIALVCVMLMCSCVLFAFNVCCSMACVCFVLLRLSVLLLSLCDSPVMYRVRLHGLHSFLGVCAVLVCGVAWVAFVVLIFGVLCLCVIVCCC